MAESIEAWKPVIFLCPSANGAFWWARANPQVVGRMSLQDKWILSIAREWCARKNRAEGRPRSEDHMQKPLGSRKPVLSLQGAGDRPRWTSRFHQPNYATSHVERDLLMRGVRWCHLRNQQERRIY